MNASGRLRSRLQRLEEHSVNMGVVGLVTPRGGTYSLADQELLRDRAKGHLAAGHSFVYIAHLARERWERRPAGDPMTETAAGTAPTATPE